MSGHPASGLCHFQSGARLQWTRNLRQTPTLDDDPERNQDSNPGSVKAEHLLLTAVLHLDHPWSLQSEDLSQIWGIVPGFRFTVLPLDSWL